MTRGGKREGAGRPKDSGKFKEKTTAIRIPLSKVEEVLRLVQRKRVEIPLYAGYVAAGLPSATEDHIEAFIDLNEQLLKHSESSFAIRASGESMINAGIFPGDLLLVDQSIEAKSGRIIIAILDGELTVKRLVKREGKVFLEAENENYPPIEIGEESQLESWGVVTNVIHAL